jgi:acyl-CoA reductase-like NAD-dependent aldehyde dehydrogenase
MSQVQDTEAATARFPSSMDRDYTMVINGLDVAGSETFRCVDPYENAEWGQVPIASTDDVDRAVAAARNAFENGWAHTSPQTRARLLRNLADLVEKNAEELTHQQVHENGKLVVEMTAGIAGLAMHARYIADLVEAREDVEVETGLPNMKARITHAPLGVIAAVTPWNSPLTLLAWKLLPALGAGCTLVIKPSEITPTSTILLAKLCLEAGFPPGVVNVVTGFGVPTATHLVNHPGIDKVAFTGSTQTGQSVMVAAAQGLKRVTLELGGKSPQIVLRDADMDRTVHGVMGGVFAASGQTCLAGSRVLVEAPVYDEFVSRLGDAAAALSLGDPMDTSIDVGPISNQRQLDTVLRYLDIASDDGAKVVAGGRRADSTPEIARGLFVEPTVLADVNPDARVAREEIFGPVVSVLCVEDADEAIRVANDSEFGLASGIWTENLDEANRLVDQLRTGTVWLNSYRVVHWAVPFGGFKMSGYGRELGAGSLDDYSEVKSVWTDLGNPQNFGRH